MTREPGERSVVTDPRPGDVLKGMGLTVTVTQLIPIDPPEGMPAERIVMVCFDSEQIPGGDSTVTLSDWQRWAASAEVVKRGEA